MFNVLHIVPENDLREHDCTPDCWCRPTFDQGELDENDLYIHNSMDGREAFEIGERLPS
jgi:hypothetical protein